MKSSLEEGRHVAELRPEGAARLFTAAFLSFWLFGWGFGETFGLSLLVTTACGALGVQLQGMPKVPLGPPALAMLAFVLFWLSLWTMGGVLALVTATRSIWGVDRIEFDATGVRVIARVGPLRRTRAFAREQVRTVTLRRGGVALETSRGAAVLTRFGSPPDHAQLRAEIEQALNLGAATAAPAELPNGWESAVDLEGMPVLQKSAGPRRRQAVFVTVLFLALAAGAAMLIGGAPSGSNAPAWVPPLMLSLLAAAVGAGAAWLWLGGEAIRLRSGEADVLRWFGSRRWLTHYAGASISVEHTRDSDGDDWYRLVLRGSAGARTLASSMRDSYPLEQVGRWIASRLGTELRIAEGGPVLNFTFRTNRTIRLGGR